MLETVLIALGVLLLYFGAEGLVLGASGIATRLNISPLVIGLTVVAFGMCAPELATSLCAAWQGRSPLVLGSVFGSNIANIGLVLGVSALVAPLPVDPLLFRREVPYLLVATLIAGPVFLNGQIDRIEGVLLLSCAVALTAITFRWSKDGRAATARSTAHRKGETSRNLGALLGFTVLGLGGLGVGGYALVNGATALAQTLGVSERALGLTLVALGNTAPELVVSVVAAARGRADLAVGNIVGSCLLNLLFVLGLTATLVPLAGRLVEVRFELITMTVLTFMMAISMRRERHISRREGALYTACYLAFLVTLGLLGKPLFE